MPPTSAGASCGRGRSPSTTCGCRAGGRPAKLGR
jgi:hypothetical protein